MKSGVRALTAFGASGVLLLTACSAGDSGDGNGDGGSGEERYELRSNDWNAPIHPFNTAGWDPLAEELEEVSDGQITLEHYPSEGLGVVTDTLNLLQSGQADLASTLVAYHPAEMPLLQITGGAAWEDAAVGAQAMWEMCQAEPFKTEILESGIVPILCTSVSPYELLLSNTQIDSVPEVFDGIRVRATGLQGQFVEALGSTITSDPSPEIYLRMEQGSIDGTTAGWYTLPALSLAEVTNHATEGLQSWNAGMIIYGMSVEAWEAYPEDIRQIFRDLGPEFSLKVAEGIDAQDDEARAAAEGEIEIHEVTDAEREAVLETVDTVLQEWVDETGSTLGLEAEAQEAFDVLVSLRDLERAPVDEWTPSSY